ncbi:MULTISPECIES: hypothetical protein [Amycolatopsis]|uniref:Uncharacterized protein n=1 Tax=Amycolatopsis albidoflavus TaxID=102226 RepID=A0ABW5I5R8_9PSEU
MNETTDVDRLTAVAFHISRHDLPATSSVDIMFKTSVTLWTHEGVGLSPFLQWIDSLGDTVEITGCIYGGGYQMRATGVLANGAPVEVRIVLRGTEFTELVKETGYVKEASFTRTQLAKLADPELLDDREPVAP